jgi:hypothetical protein
MSSLYLTCGLCGRKQADGLLSRAAWGHLENGPNGTLRACPTCKSSHDDWQTRLIAGTSASSAESAAQRV